MMQVWLYNVPNVTPTLIVGLTFQEIKQLFENPLNIHLKASPAPAETHVPIPMDVFLMSARTRQDIDRFYFEKKSIAPLYEPLWHTRATVRGTPIVIIAFSFDDLDALNDNTLQYLYQIEGKRINIPFNILICSGETREAMTEWFLKVNSITRTPVH
jgi:hypothetical protein